MGYSYPGYPLIGLGFKGSLQRFMMDSLWGERGRWCSELRA